MRFVLCALVILLPCIGFAEETQMPSQFGSIFYQLWKDSGFGKDPNRTERAAWVLLAQDDYKFLRWPASGSRSQEYWRGPMPVHTIAQVHTHASNSQGQPSAKDIKLCREIGVPIYTISARGIWMVTPDGKIQKVADAGWHK